MESLRTSCYVFALLLLASCAQQRMPGGGDKDISPPQIVRASPLPMSTGFDSRQIEIEFDEYVRLEGVRDQVLISPPLSKAPDIELRGGKKLVIDFGDEVLRENTTYTINFGEAIKDNNEGNALEENVFLFSTGDFIDTLSVQGQVLKAFYNSPCSSCLAMLFPDVHDSLVLGERPYYVARTDELGNFHISNLAEGDYRLFALVDLDADLRIDANEAMGFNEDLLRPSATDSTKRMIRLFNPLSQFSGIKDRDWSDDGRNLVLVTKGVQAVPTLQFPAIERLLFVERLEDRGDSLRYWFDSSLEDLDELVVDMDGILDTISTGRAKGLSPMLPQQLTATLEHKNADLQLFLERPYTSIDSSFILIKRDSVAVDWSLTETKDSAMKLNLEADWEEGASYMLTVLPGAIEDIYGQINDSLVTLIPCPADRTFGILTLDINLPDVGRNYHLELLDKSKKVIQTRTTEGSMKWSLEYLSPSDYMLRVFIDEDGDGTWSTGDFEAKEQPEPVFMMATPISVRANWEMEQVIEVSFN